MEKIIFLDVDGVLNSWKEVKRLPKGSYGLLGTFDIHVERLARIVKQTGAKIVLSSSWRSGFYFTEDKHFQEHITDKFKQFGIEVFSTTGFDLDRNRGKEILAWILLHNKPIDTILIIDDEVKDISEFFNKKRIIKTSMKKGLQEKDVKKAIKILGKE